MEKSVRWRTPCHSESDIDFDLIFVVFLFFFRYHRRRNLGVFVLDMDYPRISAALFAQKNFRLSLTLPLDKNKLMLRFRRLRRDSHFPVETQFL